MGFILQFKIEIKLYMNVNLSGYKDRLKIKSL